MDDMLFMVNIDLFSDQPFDISKLSIVVWLTSAKVTTLKTLKRVGLLYDKYIVITGSNNTRSTRFSYEQAYSGNYHKPGYNKWFELSGTPEGSNPTKPTPWGNVAAEQVLMHKDLAKHYISILLASLGSSSGNTSTPLQINLGIKTSEAKANSINDQLCKSCGVNTTVDYVKDAIQGPYYRILVSRSDLQKIEVITRAITHPA
jgi:hypothetical protein